MNISIYQHEKFYLVFNNSKIYIYQEKSKNINIQSVEDIRR